MIKSYSAVLKCQFPARLNHFLSPGVRNVRMSWTQISTRPKGNTAGFFSFPASVHHPISEPLQHLPTKNSACHQNSPQTIFTHLITHEPSETQRDEDDKGFGIKRETRCVMHSENLRRLWQLGHINQTAEPSFLQQQSSQKTSAAASSFTSVTALSKGR